MEVDEDIQADTSDAANQDPDDEAMNADEEPFEENFEVLEAVENCISPEECEDDNLSNVENDSSFTGDEDESQDYDEDAAALEREIMESDEHFQDIGECSNSDNEMGSSNISLKSDDDKILADANQDVQDNIESVNVIEDSNIPEDSAGKCPFKHNLEFEDEVGTVEESKIIYDSISSSSNNTQSSPAGEQCIEDEGQDNTEASIKFSSPCEFKEEEEKFIHKNCKPDSVTAIKLYVPNSPLKSSVSTFSEISPSTSNLNETTNQSETHYQFDKNLSHHVDYLEADINNSEKEQSIHQVENTQETVESDSESCIDDKSVELDMIHPKEKINQTLHQDFDSKIKEENKTNLREEELIVGSKILKNDSHLSSCGLLEENTNCKNNEISQGMIFNTESIQNNETCTELINAEFDKNCDSSDDEQSDKDNSNKCDDPRNKNNSTEYNDLVYKDDLNKCDDPESKGNLHKWDEPTNETLSKYDEPADKEILNKCNDPRDISTEYDDIDKYGEPESKNNLPKWDEPTSGTISNKYDEPADIDNLNKTSKTVNKTCNKEIFESESCISSQKEINSENKNQIDCLSFEEASPAKDDPEMYITYSKCDDHSNDNEYKQQHIQETINDQTTNIDNIDNIAIGGIKTNIPDKKVICDSECIDGKQTNEDKINPNAVNVFVDAHKINQEKSACSEIDIDVVKGESLINNAKKEMGEVQCSYSSDKDVMDSNNIDTNFSTSLEILSDENVHDRMLDKNDSNTIKQENLTKILSIQNEKNSSDLINNERRQDECAFFAAAEKHITNSKQINKNKVRECENNRKLADETIMKNEYIDANMITEESVNIDVNKNVEEYVNIDNKNVEESVNIDANKNNERIMVEVCEDDKQFEGNESKTKNMESDVTIEGLVIADIKADELCIAAEKSLKAEITSNNSSITPAEKDDNLSPKNNNITLEVEVNPENLITDCGHVISKLKNESSPQVVNKCDDPESKGNLHKWDEPTNETLSKYDEPADKEILNKCNDPRDISTEYDDIDKYGEPESKNNLPKWDEPTSGTISNKYDEPADIDNLNKTSENVNKTCNKEIFESESCISSQKEINSENKNQIDCLSFEEASPAKDNPEMYITYSKCDDHSNDNEYKQQHIQETINDQTTNIDNIDNIAIGGIGTNIPDKKVICDSECMDCKQTNEDKINPNAVNVFVDAHKINQEKSACSEIDIDVVKGESLINNAKKEMGEVQCSYSSDKDVMDSNNIDTNFSTSLEILSDENVHDRMLDKNDSNTIKQENLTKILSIQNEKNSSDLINNERRQDECAFFAAAEKHITNSKQINKNKVRECENNRKLADETIMKNEYIDANMITEESVNIDVNKNVEEYVNIDNKNVEESVNIDANKNNERIMVEVCEDDKQFEGNESKTKNMESDVTIEGLVIADIKADELCIAAEKSLKAEITSNNSSITPAEKDDNLSPKNNNITLEVEVNPEDLITDCGHVISKLKNESSPQAVDNLNIDSKITLEVEINPEDFISGIGISKLKDKPNQQTLDNLCIESSKASQVASSQDEENKDSDTSDSDAKFGSYIDISSFLININKKDDIVDENLNLYEDLENIEWHSDHHDDMEMADNLSENEENKLETPHSPESISENKLETPHSPESSSEHSDDDNNKKIEDLKSKEIKEEKKEYSQKSTKAADSDKKDNSQTLIPDKKKKVLRSSSNIIINIKEITKDEEHSEIKKEKKQIIAITTDGLAKTTPKPSSFMEIPGEEIEGAAFSRLVIIGEYFTSAYHEVWPKDFKIKPYFLYKRKITVDTVYSQIFEHPFLKNSRKILIVFMFGAHDLAKYSTFKSLKCRSKHSRLKIVKELNCNSRMSFKCLSLMSNLKRRIEADGTISSVFCYLPMINFVKGIVNTCSSSRHNCNSCICYYSINHDEAETASNNALKGINRKIFFKNLNEMEGGVFEFLPSNIQFQDDEWMFSNGKAINVKLLSFQLNEYLFEKRSNDRGVEISSINLELILMRQKLVGESSLKILVIGDAWMKCVAEDWSTVQEIQPLFYCKDGLLLNDMKNLILSITCDEEILVITAVPSGEFFSISHFSECKDHTSLQYPVPEEDLIEDPLKYAEYLSKKLDLFVLNLRESRKNCEVVFLTCYPTYFKPSYRYLLEEHTASHPEHVSVQTLNDKCDVSDFDVKVERCLRKLNKHVLTLNKENGLLTCNIFSLVSKLSSLDMFIFPIYIQHKCPPISVLGKLLELFHKYIYSLADMVTYKRTIEVDTKVQKENLTDFAQEQKINIKQEPVSSVQESKSVEKQTDKETIKKADSHSKEADSHSKEIDSHLKETDSYSKETDSHLKETDSHSKETDSHSKEADSHLQKKVSVKIPSNDKVAKKQFSAADSKSVVKMERHDESEEKHSTSKEKERRLKEEKLHGKNTSKKVSAEVKEKSSTSSRSTRYSNKIKEESQINYDDYRIRDVTYDRRRTPPYRSFSPGRSPQYSHRYSRNLYPTHSRSRSRDRRRRSRSRSGHRRRNRSRSNSRRRSYVRSRRSRDRRRSRSNDSDRRRKRSRSKSVSKSKSSYYSSRCDRLKRTSKKRTRSPSSSDPPSKRSAKSTEEAAITNLWDIHSKECDMYRRNPGIHPDHDRVKRKWIDVMNSQGLNTNDTSILGFWNEYWSKKMDELFKVSWEEKKETCLSILSTKSQHKDKEFSRSRSSSLTRSRSSSEDSESPDRKRKQKKKSKNVKKKSKKESKHKAKNKSNKSTDSEMNDIGLSVEDLENRLNEYMKKAKESHGAVPLHVEPTAAASLFNKKELFKPIPKATSMKENHKLLDITSILCQISDRFGALGMSLTLLHEKALECSQNEANPFDYIDEDTKMLLDLIVDKIKKILKESELTFIQRAIIQEAHDRLVPFLKAYEKRKGSPFGVDIDSLAKATLGLQVAEIIGLIRADVTHRGYATISNEDLMSIYLEIKSYQVKLVNRKDNEIDKASISQGSSTLSHLSGMTGSGLNQAPTRAARIRNEFLSLSLHDKVDKFARFHTLPFEEKSFLLSYLDEMEQTDKNLTNSLRVIILKSKPS